MRVVWICIILGIYVALMSMVGYYSCYSKKWYQLYMGMNINAIITFLVLYVYVWSHKESIAQRIDDRCPELLNTIPQSYFKYINCPVKYISTAKHIEELDCDKEHLRIVQESGYGCLNIETCCEKFNQKANTVLQEMEYYPFAASIGLLITLKILFMLIKGVQQHVTDLTKCVAVMMLIIWICISSISLIILYEQYEGASLSQLAKE